MAAVRQPFGFKPGRNLAGLFNPSTRRHPVNSTGLPIFIGEPVALISGNIVRSWIRSATGTEKVHGIVAQCLDANQKPLVFSQPNKGPFLAAADVGFVDVYTDPNNVYLAATDITAGTANVQQYAFVTANNSANANNRVGRSPLCIGLTTTSAASSTNYPFQILGPAMSQRDYLTNTDWTEGVEVIVVSDDLA